jgi:hypothetical protein
MKFSNFTVVAVILLLLSGTPDATEQETKQTPSGQFAKIVETLLADMTVTEYQHDTEIDEDAGVLKCDCSGLIGHVLRRHFPEAYLHVDGKTRPDRVRPLAANYCETFIAAGEKDGEKYPWKQIAKVEDLRPGDIFAWKKRKIVKGETTGHVLMIQSIPKRQKGGLYRVRVVDSTRSPHANDTRTSKTLGVGSGEMWLSADEDGRLNGFQVSARSGVSMKNILSAGRIVEVVGATPPLCIDDRDYLQLETETARSLADKRGLKSRVIEEDGETHSVTRKVDKTRVNFVIAKGRVIRVTRG